MKNRLRALIGEGIERHEERKEAWILAGKPGERPTVMDSIADHLLANGVTFVTDNHVGGKWIPVTERLPEKEKAVLLRFASGDMVVGDWYYEEEGTTSWESHTDDGWVTYCEGKITHWMPLPEPPMRKGENG